MTGVPGIALTRISDRLVMAWTAGALGRGVRGLCHARCEVIAMCSSSEGTSRALGRAALAVQLPPAVAGGAVLAVAGGVHAVPVVAVWLLGSVLAMSRASERLLVRCLGFRRVSSGQWRRLAPVAGSALAGAGIGRGEIDWYVRRGAEANAFAVGRRSVAVSSGLIAGLVSGRLDDDLVHAVLVHELGHHATCATRYALAVRWLVAPWRLWSRFVAAVCVAVVGRRLPTQLCALVVVAAVGVAVAQAAQRGDWATAVTLCSVVVCLVAVPLLDAWVARRAEWAADRFAAAAGVGHDLARALTVLTVEPVSRAGWPTRLLARHPDRHGRIVALRSDERPDVLHNGHPCNTMVGAEAR